MRANMYGPSLVMKHFLPKLNREKRSIFAALSARIGSISDNKLGGWYSYRAAKAALNMMIKGASIEVARCNPKAVIVGLHPGTVDSNLSSLFQRNISPGKLFSPEYSVSMLYKVVENATVDVTGNLIAYDGKVVEP